MPMAEKMVKPGTQVKIGLAFLILASFSKLYLHAPRFALSDDLSDGVTGLLYGLSIGFMLLGLWRSTDRSGSEQ